MKHKPSAKVEQIYHDLQLYSYGSDTWVYIRPNDVGDMKYSIKNADHYGWLVCDGRSLSRELYSELFAIIGTTYGNNDETTFKLPDCRGRVLGAIGTGTGLTARSAGTLLGAETHTLTASEMPSHTHTSNAVGGTLGLITANGSNTAGGDVDSTAVEPNLYAAPAALTINSTGGGGAHNNMQPTAFIGNVFIYAINNIVQNN
jgi:microcystin-dependent protein